MSEFDRISILVDPEVLAKIMHFCGDRLKKRMGKHDKSTMIREAMIIYVALLESLGTVDYEVVLQAAKDAVRKKDP